MRVTNLAGLEAFSLAGRKALVTGGNRGLGFAFAKAIGQCGAEVSIVGRSEHANEEAVGRLADAGVRATDIAADLCVDADVTRAMAAAFETMGGLDVLIRNAGTCIRK